MRVDDLVRLEETGELPEFVLFWGGKRTHGGVGKGCLSHSGIRRRSPSAA
ncbi:MAG TPA: hypothetical protein VGP70_03145 [Actinomadura sp.]|jgi:hypothetical protein|nr:hypothetical protein [Actinomadura sp.]